MKVETLTARPRVSPITLALAYLRVGATAFGFTILQQLKAFVVGRDWLTVAMPVLAFSSRASEKTTSRVGRPARRFCCADFLRTGI
jgi:hypothetical protein